MFFCRGERRLCRYPTDVFLTLAQRFPNWGARPPRGGAWDFQGGRRDFLRYGGRGGARPPAGESGCPPKISVTFDISTLYAVEIAKYYCLFSFAKTF